MNKNSAGAKDRKSNLVMLVVMAAATLLVGLSIFVMDTDLHKFANRAGLIPNLLGGACLVGSWVWLYFGQKNEWDSKAAIGWFVLIAAGFLVSCGFNFDYFGIK